MDIRLKTKMFRLKLLAINPKNARHCLSHVVAAASWENFETLATTISVCSYLESTSAS